MVAAQATKNHGNKWGLTWYLQWWLYTPIPNRNNSQTSVPAADTPSLKISSYGTSIKLPPRPSQSVRE